MLSPTNGLTRFPFTFHWPVGSASTRNWWMNRWIRLFPFCPGGSCRPASRRSFRELWALSQTHRRAACAIVQRRQNEDDEDAEIAVAETDERKRALSFIDAVFTATMQRSHKRRHITHRSGACYILLWAELLQQHQNHSLPHVHTLETLFVGVRAPAKRYTFNLYSIIYILYTIVLLFILCE